MSHSKYQLWEYIYYEKEKKIQSLPSQVIAINLSKADSFLLKPIYCEMKKQNNNTSFPKLLTCFGGLKPKFNMPCRNRPIYIFYSAWHGRLKLPPLWKHVIEFLVWYLRKYYIVLRCTTVWRCLQCTPIQSTIYYSLVYILSLYLDFNFV